MTIDSGDNQEEVVVTAVTATTFTAVFTKAHNGTAAPFPIVGFVDERRRLNVRVIRYTNAGSADYVPATDARIRGQFEHANHRWNTIGLQIDRQPTIDRPIPPNAVDGDGIYTGSWNNTQETAALTDLIPITPDNTITVIFVDKTGGNAYVTLNKRTHVTLGDRYFIFIDTTLDPNGDTLAHEFHHVLFNRGDDHTLRQFFTFNTHPSAFYGLALPDVRVRRRIHNHHTADPNNDPNNDNVINWARRLRITRFPIAGDLEPAADNTTGNTLTQDF